MFYLENKQELYAVLLAGGEGSRFWPQSRTLEPKQFLTLDKGKTLFRQSIDRIVVLIPRNNIFIVSSDLYKDIIRKEAVSYNIPHANLIFEPEPKNTAPAIALAIKCIHGQRKSNKARVVVLPCDHLIKNKKQFLYLLKQAFNCCNERLVVFGIPPDRPATGYGYIKASKRNMASCRSLHIVSRFCEKPDIKTAKQFLKSGQFLWNSGIFVGTVENFLRSIKAYLPKLFKQISSLEPGRDISKIWNKIDAVSFDYGVLEKTRNLGMIRAVGLGWSDLGSWQAWDELQIKDKDGNVLLADVVNIGSHDITVLGNKHLIAAIGLKGLIVIDTPDALLIADKDKSEDVKKVVQILKAKQRQEHYCHTTVRRPWGTYTILDTASGFKIKLVEVYSKKSLSLQLHKKRSEHWIVIEGTAKVIKGKKSYFVYANQSTFIPKACVHRLENPKNSILKIIEVQTGDYLSEDDIVRIKDDFGRIIL